MNTIVPQASGIPNLDLLPPLVAKSVLDHIQALVSQFAPPEPARDSPSPDMPANEWIASHRKWLDSLPQRSGTTMDDSRESIYAGCGE